MNEETLDRLMTDQALDALPPDTAALLAAYVADHPGAAKRGAEIREAASLARITLAAPAAISHPLPPLKFAVLPQDTRSRDASWRAAWPRLAAACAVGLFLGLLARPLATQPKPSAPAAIQADIVKTAAATPASEFWSLNRVAQMQRRHLPTRPPRITWNSPLQTPQLNP